MTASNSTGSLPERPEEFRYLILALQRQGSRQLNSLFGQIGLTNSQAEAIDIIGTYGPLSTKEAGQYLVCESGSPSRLLAALERKGLTVTSRPPHDRRATLHALSPQGRETLQKMLLLKHDFERDLSAALEEIGDVHSGNILTRLASMLHDPDLRAAMQRRYPQLFAE